MSKGRASDDDETDFSAASAWDIHNETMAYGTPAAASEDDDGADPWSTPINKTQRYAPPPTPPPAPPPAAAPPPPPAASPPTTTAATSSRAQLIEWILAPPAGVEREVPARLSSIRTLKPPAAAGRAFRLAPPAGVDDP